MIIKKAKHNNRSLVNKPPFYNHKNKDLFGYTLILLSCFVLLNINGFSWYNNDFTTYGVNALSRIGLFKNYYLTDAICESITPQIVSDYIMIMLIKLGFSYKVTMYIMYLVTNCVLISGMIYSSKIFLSDLSARKAGVICTLECVFIGFSRLGYEISGNLLWITSFYHQSIAIALVLWIVTDIYLKKWKSAMILCTIATLFQMHIGTYAFVAVISFMLLDIYENKQWKLLKNISFWIIPIVPFVLLILSSSTGNSISNIEYIELYGRFRHPHHMIPSSWEMKELIKYVIIVCLLIFLAKFSYRLSKDWFRGLQFYGYLTAVGMFANWIFTDICPLPLVLKLQPARMLIILNILIMFLITKMAASAYEERRSGELIYIITLSIMSYEADVKFITMLIVLACLKRWKCSKQREAVLVIVSILCILEGIASAVMDSRHIIVIGLALCIFFVDILLEHKNLRGMVVGACFISLISIGTNKVNYTENNVDFELLDIAGELKYYSSVNEQYFADPLNSNLAAVALYSERGTYCFYKNVPIIDDALKEWKVRLEKCGIIEKQGERYFLNPMSLDENEQIQLCKDYNIDYILIEGDEKEFIDNGNVSLLSSKGKYKLLKII